MRDWKKISARLWKLIILAVTVVIHIVVILTITVQTGEKQEREDTTIFKVVDLEEYVPPPEPKPEKKPEKKEIEPEEQIEIPRQEPIAEEIIEEEKEVIVEESDAAPSEGTPEPIPAPEPEEKVIEYLPQHKISVPPRLDVDAIRSRITYPPLANRQKIEGVVFLELYIDKEGLIRKIKVLKDPGYGFADAAIEALEGMTVEPARANGTAVAVRYRYPIRFKIK